MDIHGKRCGSTRSCVTLPDGEMEPRGRSTGRLNAPGKSLLTGRKRDHLRNQSGLALRRVKRQALRGEREHRYRADLGDAGGSKKSAATDGRSYVLARDPWLSSARIQPCMMARKAQRKQNSVGQERQRPYDTENE